jgi:hypothetical protein
LSVSRNTYVGRNVTKAMNITTIGGEHRRRPRPPLGEGRT